MKYFSENYRETYKEAAIEGVKGSGGCFPAGTLVRTDTGWKPIELIRPGNIVIGYTRQGNLEFGLVSETLVHTIGTYSDDLFFLYNEETCIFPKGITGNHAVYDRATEEHKEIKDFAVGEELTDIYGNPITITNIIAKSNSELTESVYNLIVNPLHTYIVGSEELGIRVHNGGGGKGGSPRPAVEAKNTLHSYATAKVLEIISAGEIVGVVGGAKGVYFDKTPLQNSNDSFNYEDIDVQFRVGTPDQTAIEGFDEVEIEDIISAQEITTDVPVVRTISAGIPRARVTIGVPQGLQFLDKVTGDLNGSRAAYAIYTKSLSGVWVHVLDAEIKDKATYAAEVDHIIEAPADAGNDPWQIRFIRTNSGGTGEPAHRKSRIDSSRVTFLEPQDPPLTYPNVALVGLKVPAESTGNSIPVRSYLVQGLKVLVPTNFDPVTRTYSGGFWNGTFKREWTNDTAWILYDLLTDQEAGVNSYLNTNLEIDKWDFFQASLYNNCITYNSSTDTYTKTLIPDGSGGFIHRFTCNVVINTQQTAWQLLHAVASNMRAVLVHKGTAISILQDRPREAKRIINNSNVIDGLFVYSSTDATDKATIIRCMFNDKDEQYLPRPVLEQATEEEITRYGYRVKDIVAYGVTDEPSARYMAKWALYSELHQGDLVAFSLSLNICDLAIGDVVAVMDNDYVSDANIFLSGKVLSASNTTVVLDREVTLVNGLTFTLGIMNENYTAIFERNILNVNATTNTLELTSPLPMGDYNGREFFCYSSGNVEPRPFMITSITESQKGIYSIAGIFYSNDKFATIEQGLVIIPPDYSIIYNDIVPKVTNIAFRPTYLNTSVFIGAGILVSWEWEWPSNANTREAILFNIRWRREYGEFHYARDIQLKEYTIPNALPGLYEVFIEAVTSMGKKSIPANNTYEYKVNATTTTLLPPVNFYVQNTTDVYFLGTDLVVTWDYNEANDDISLATEDRLLDYVVEIWDLTSEGVHLATVTLSSVVEFSESLPLQFNQRQITPNFARGGSFTYSFEQNRNDFGIPRRNLTLRVYSRDLSGNLSAPVEAMFQNPAALPPTFTIYSGFEQVYLEILSTPEVDHKYYKVYKSNTVGFPKDETTLVYKGPDTYITIPADAETTYYYAVSSIDSFGEFGETVSSEQVKISSSIDAVSYTYLNLMFIPNSPVTNRVSWSEFTVVQNKTAQAWLVEAGTAIWTTGTLFIYWIPGEDVLKSTTSMVAAISAGGRILASYKGGIDLSHAEGGAYIDGDTIIAGTVGSSQLITNTAVITSAAQIETGIINNVHIGNIIQSNGYDPITYNGWQIDKDGNITSYGSFRLYNTDGDAIFDASTELDGAFIKAASISDASITNLNAAKIINNTLINVKTAENFAELDVTRNIDTDIISLTKSMLHKEANRALSIRAEVSIVCESLASLMLAFYFNASGGAYAWSDSHGEYLVLGGSFSSSTSYACRLAIVNSSTSIDTRFLSGTIALTATRLTTFTGVDLGTKTTDLIFVGDDLTTTVWYRHQGGTGSETKKVSNRRLIVEDIYA